MCGCDKTHAVAGDGARPVCDIPAMVVSGGPMLNGKFHGKDIGSGTDVLALQRSSESRDHVAGGVQ